MSAALTDGRTAGQARTPEVPQGVPLVAGGQESQPRVGDGLIIAEGSGYLGWLTIASLVDLARLATVHRAALRRAGLDIRTYRGRGGTNPSEDPLVALDRLHNVRRIASDQSARMASKCGFDAATIEALHRSFPHAFKS